MALIWLFPALSTVSNLDRSIGPYKWPTWCAEQGGGGEDEKKKTVISQQTPGMWTAATQSHYFPIAGAPGLAAPCVSPRPGVPRGAGRGGPAAPSAAGNCRRMGFGGPLCTRLGFPSDRTTAKFDFVRSEGSLDLCSLPVCKWYAAGPFAITFKMHPRHRLSGERWPLPQPGWKLDFKVPRWNFQVRDAGLDQIT